MTSASGTKLISHIDCPGGGQVWDDKNTLYVGHMRQPAGTSIYNVSDPANPVLLSRIEMPVGWHSHKVRVADDVMLVNHERQGMEGSEDFGGGLGIYDVSRPENPRLITKWRTHGKGVHRYSFDGRYAYISPTAEGFIGNIVMILDLINPEAPEEVGRWWIPGQWEAGGEEYPWHQWVTPRCHHPLRRGERLYVSYWHHGMFILDISDLSTPKMVSSLNTSPAFPHPTHTCLAMPSKQKGRDVLLVADEDVAKLWECEPAFCWVYDISNEVCPIPISTYQVPGLNMDGSPQPPMTGCHQPSERIEGSIVPFAWFAQGMRLVDFSDPYQPNEVGHFIPDTPSGSSGVSSNDVTIDDRGLIYLLDRQQGLDIIETSLL